MPRKNLAECGRAGTAPGSGADLDISGSPDRALLYRQVEGASVDALNEATHGIRGRKIERVLDTFTLALVQEHKLAEARGYSTFERPRRIEDLAEELETATGSLAHPVTATVLDVKPHRASEVAVYLGYPSLFEEQRALVLAAQEALGLSAPRSLAPIATYVTVLEGQLPRRGQTAQLESIREALPEDIELSAVQRHPDLRT